MACVTLTPDLQLLVSQGLITRKQAENMLPPKYDESATICEDVMKKSDRDFSGFTCKGCSIFKESHTFMEGECRYKKYGDKYYEQQQSNLWCMVGSEYALLKYCTIVKLKNRPEEFKNPVFPLGYCTGFFKGDKFRIDYLDPCEDKILKRVFVNIREIKGFSSQER